MGFLAGRVTFLRFHVNGPRPRGFNEDHLGKLDAHRAGRQRIASADGIEAGWSGGDHVLDTDFDLAKNIVNDALLFDLRVDTEKAPSDLMRAYTAIELKSLIKDNPSGFASARQKREAREAARERLEQEGKDGRHTKRKCVPVMWDSKTNEVLFGATAISHIDRFASLFQQTFGHGLDMVTAGKRAYRLAELHEKTRQVDDASPSEFVAGITPNEISWCPDESSRDFIGNEFLMWLWYHLEVENDTLKLMDDTDATVMLARSLTLECPRAVTGSDTIKHEGPTRLPEAKRALQSGKLPRKAGLTVVRHSDQFEFALHAETLAVGAAKLPPVGEDIKEERARQEERITQIRDLIETVDLVYDAFGDVRFNSDWSKKTLPALQKWLMKVS
ncbi:hypothetical protein BH11PLA2_BH11PLA2_43670 [soil metagenome]